MSKGMTPEEYLQKLRAAASEAGVRLDEYSASRLLEGLSLLSDSYPRPIQGGDTVLKTLTGELKAAREFTFEERMQFQFFVGNVQAILDECLGCFDADAEKDADE